MATVVNDMVLIRHGETEWSRDRRHTGTTDLPLVDEGRRTIDIRDEIPDWSVWTHEIIGGETIEHVGQRVDRVIVESQTVDGAVAVFAHAHFLRILAARWIGLDPAGGRNFVLDPASVSVLSFERGERVILRWNQTRR